MIAATRRWLRRNRTKFAMGIGVIGVGYVAGQYVISKITEARERMTSERTSKENLRRRFQQNQEDCTITVLELLPTVTESILEALPAERISKEIQQKNAERMGKSAIASEIAPSDFSSGAPSVIDEDGKSMGSLQSESYIHASQMAASTVSSGDRPVRTKIQLWNDLKIASITRVFTLIYTLTLLSLLTRIQLNLLGRKNYLASAVALATHSAHDPTISLENHDDDNVERSFGNDFEINRKYLTFSWWLLHRGWREILSTVEIAVRDVFGPIRPSEELHLEQLSSQILDVRRKVEGSTPEERRTRKWLPYLLPPLEEEEYVLRESGVLSPPAPFSSPPSQDPTSLPSPPASPLPHPSATSAPPLRHLLDETSDLIDSPLFTTVLTLLLDTAFSRLTDEKIRSEAFKPRNARASSTLASDPLDVINDDAVEKTAKLASVMAVMTREARAIGGGVPNEYVQAMDGVGELEGFAAVVYCGNLDMEAGLGDDLLPLSNEELKSTEENSIQSQNGGGGIGGAATRVAYGAWSGFENVWSRVTGA